jgi:ribonuclease HII
MSKRRAKTSNLMYENQIRSQGFERILGMDEAGRGAWAGPVAVGAVCLPLGMPKLNKILTDVRDSKEMTPRQRARVVETIKETALAWGVGSASNEEIDSMGIDRATKLAMTRALTDSQTRYPSFQPDCLFLDALIWPEMVAKYPQVTIVDGDARSLSIAAASIVAKTWRDELMTQIGDEFPHYGFGEHKGYGTGKHHAVLKTLGISPLHRVSFAPIRKLIRTDG